MNNDFDYIFGCESKGDSPKDRALSSKLLFSRSQDHLAIAKKTSKGRTLTAFEAYLAYGTSILQEVADRGTAILASSIDEPGKTLKVRRESLGLSINNVAQATGLKVADITDCENSKTRSPIRNIEKVAIALGLDERKVSISKGANGDAQLAARLKQLGGNTRFSPTSVLKFSEAAWVIETQNRLTNHFIESVSKGKIPEFTPNDDYGNKDYPVWKVGYSLAEKTREILNISADEPINSMRDICANLGIPVLQAELPKYLAGATITNGCSRGILINTSGFNSNVWVRRATIAHELGHVLWDSDQHIEKIRVDKYDGIGMYNKTRFDHVEARANAFAVAFLAPPRSVEQVYRCDSPKNGEIRYIMELFGISYSVAKQHILNVIGEQFRADELPVDSDATDDWRGRESFTDDFFPLPKTSSLRRGDFAGVVIQAQKNGLISMDTAAEYLGTNIDNYSEKSDSIASLYDIDLIK